VPSAQTADNAFFHTQQQAPFAADIPVNFGIKPILHTFGEALPADA
jgi:hypothetical protein